MAHPEGYRIVMREGVQDVISLRGVDSHCRVVCVCMQRYSPENEGSNKIGKCVVGGREGTCWDGSDSLL